MRSLIALTALVCIGWSCAEAGERTIAGRIVDFDGKPEHYQVLRDGHPLPIQKPLDLVDGDEITVLQDARRIFLVLYNGDGLLVELTKPKGRFVVQAGQLPNVSVNIMRWLWGWLATAHEEHEASTVSMHVRGAGGNALLSLPLLSEWAGHLVAGTRPLALAWQGGQAPYRVRVRQADAVVPVLAMDLVPESRVRTAPIVLQPGTYVVEIQDSKGSQIGGRVEVLPDSQAPTEPEELAQTRLSDPMHDTLVAMWLASLDDGAWAFEAYQRVAPVAGSYYPASLLREALEQGERPAAMLPLDR